MRCRLALAAGLLLPLLLLACGGDDSDSSGDEPGTPITVPLEAGARWTYDASSVTDGDSPQTWTQVDSVIGQATVEGLPYWMLESLTDGESPDTSYVRQSGQTVTIIPAGLPTGGSSAILSWAMRQLDASLPWKVADFTSPKGQIASFEADTSFAAENLTLRLQINSANLGRTSVEVPAGSYTDVYKGRLTQLFLGSQGGIPILTLTTTLDVYIKDGVGVIRQVTVGETSQTGQPAIVTTTTTSLRSYSGAP
jgi:hypothetical protein